MKSTKTLEFYEALKSSADYAANIASRQVEAPDTRERSRALASKLRSLSGT